MTKPTMGRIVHYRLTELDAAQINSGRADYAAYLRLANSSAAPAQPGQTGRTGLAAHKGNPVSAGEYYPAQVVRRFNPEGTTVNLQVSLDGNDLHWATSVSEGDGDGQWIWPPREAD